jgi:NAD(P)-dependent dehydrogenase (short-subunit alcohol dehydrogenase family)
VLEFMAYASGANLPAALNFPTGSGAYANQRVLVTGADTAVGRLAAVAFAREGARVGLTGDSAAALAETASLAGDHATVLGEDGDHGLVEQVCASWGVPGIVINNAGSVAARGFAELIAAYAEGGTIINVARPPHTVLERSTKRLRTDFGRDGVRIATVAADTLPAATVVDEIVALVGELRP